MKDQHKRLISIGGTSPLHVNHLDHVTMPGRFHEEPTHTGRDRERGDARSRSVMSIQKASSDRSLLTNTSSLSRAMSADSDDGSRGSLFEPYSPISNQSNVFTALFKKKADVTLFGKHIWQSCFVVLDPSKAELLVYRTEKDFKKRNLPALTLSIDRLVECVLNKKRLDIVMEGGGKLCLDGQDAQGLKDQLDSFDKAIVKPLPSELAKEMYWRQDYVPAVDIRKHLAHTPFGLLPDTRFRTLASFLTVTEYSLGTFVYDMKDDFGAYLYIIVDGLVSLSVPDPGGGGQLIMLREFVAGEMLKLDFVNEDGISRSAVAQTTSRTIAIEMTKENFELYSKTEPDILCIDFLKQICGMGTIDLLRDISLLSGMSTDMLRQVSALNQFKAYRSGAHIYAEGDRAEYMYLILWGKIRVSSVSEEDHVTYLSAGSVCGEVSMMIGVPQIGTAVAQIDSMVFQLRQDDYARMLNALPLASQEKVWNIVKLRMLERLQKFKIPFFQGIPSSKFEVLAGLCKIKAAKAGDVLCKQGDVGDVFYMIVKGKCVVKIKNAETGEETAIAQLGAGQYFGEIALVCDSKRQATVQCVEQTANLVITSERFNEFFAEAPEALADFEIKLAGDKVKLRSILYHPAGIHFFTKFLQDEFSVENVEFWKVARAYRHMEEHHIVAAAKALKNTPDNVDQAETRVTQQFRGFGQTTRGRIVSTRSCESDYMTAEEPPLTTEQAQRNIQDSAEDIYNGFISSPEEHDGNPLVGSFSYKINIDAQTRQDVKAAIDAGDVNIRTLDTCVEKIQKLMEADSFQRFKTSVHFKELMTGSHKYQDIQGDRTKRFSETKRTMRSGSQVDMKKNRGKSNPGENPKLKSEEAGPPIIVERTKQAQTKYATMDACDRASGKKKRDTDGGRSSEAFV